MIAWRVRERRRELLASRRAVIVSERQQRGGEQPQYGVLAIAEGRPLLARFPDAVAVEEEHAEMQPREFETWIDLDRRRHPLDRKPDQSDLGMLDGQQIEGAGIVRLARQQLLQVADGGMQIARAACVQ